MTCIYCSAKTGPNDGRAHIFPEALCHNNETLPEGYECSACNGYFGSALDPALIAHNHIWPIIQMLGLPGKKNKERKKLGFIYRSSGTWQLKPTKNDIKKISFSEKGIQIEGKNSTMFDDLKFRRALHRIAFDYLSKATGHEHALNSIFDNLRNYVRRAQKEESWPYAQIISPMPPVLKRLEANAVFQDGCVIIKLTIFNDDFYVDLLNRPEFEGWCKNNLRNYIWQIKKGNFYYG